MRKSVTNAYSNGYCYGHANCNGDSYGYCYRYAQTYAYAAGSAHTEATPDSAAPPVGLTSE